MRFPQGVADCNCWQEVDELHIERIANGYVLTVRTAAHHDDRYHVKAEDLESVVKSMWRPGSSTQGGGKDFIAESAERMKRSIRSGWLD